MKLFESEVVEVTTRDKRQLDELKLKCLFNKKYAKHSKFWSWKNFCFLHKLELHNLPFE